jgi:hypothetical protein
MSAVMDAGITSEEMVWENLNLIGVSKSKIGFLSKGSFQLL